MVGLFNDGWNKYQADADLGLNNIGAQLTLTPFEGLTAYINYLQGSAKGTVIDLTGSYQVTDKFKLGFNVADFSGAKDTFVFTSAVVADPTATPPVAGVAEVLGTDGYTGFALYPSYKFSDNFTLGLRAENFKAKKLSSTFSNVIADESVTAYTLSANLKSGGLTFIPEFRMDSGSAKMFADSDMALTKSASQVSLAVVYGF